MELASIALPVCFEAGNNFARHLQENPRKVVYIPRRSFNDIFCPFDVFVLFRLCQFNETYIPAADTDLKIGIPLRLLLCFFQLLRIENVEMDNSSMLFEVGKEQGLHSH